MPTTTPPQTRSASPGPWHQHTDGEKTYASVRSLSGHTVADCGSRSDQTAQSNARLIAATPALLELAKELADWSGPQYAASRALGGFQEQARAAIAAVERAIE